MLFSTIGTSKYIMFSLFFVQNLPFALGYRLSPKTHWHQVGTIEVTAFQAKDTSEPMDVDAAAGGEDTSRDWRWMHRILLACWVYWTRWLCRPLGSQQACGSECKNVCFCYCRVCKRGPCWLLQRWGGGQKRERKAMRQ